MHKKKIDYVLVVIVVMLVVFGLAILYSTSAYNGRVKFDDAAFYLKKQLFATILGVPAMIFIAAYPYSFWIRFAPVTYGVSLLLSLLVLFIGDTYNGSRRWLSIGPISFQPSELSKIAVILFLSWFIDRFMKKRVTVRFALLLFALVMPMVALVGTNNLSTAVIILGIAVILIFLSNPKYVQFIWMTAGGIAMVAVFLSMESYRLERLAVWRDPEAYDKGFQTIQGLYAIGSGGIFGCGFGQGMQKLGFVPEAQNDMIFSVVCEELGLVGALFVIVLFGIMLWRLYRTAVSAKHLLGLLLVSGIFAHIALQVLLNIAVVTNAVPNTGVTLPFISYGGTSILFLMAEMGLAMSVSRHY